MVMWHHDMSRFTPDGPGPVHAAPSPRRFEHLTGDCSVAARMSVGMSQVLLVCHGAGFVSAMGDGQESKKTATPWEPPKTADGLFPWFSAKKNVCPALPLPGMTTGTAGKVPFDLPSERDHAVGSITSL